MKEFYRRANILLKVRRANPVVTKIQRVDQQGEVAVYDDKSIVEKQIAEYFTEIYKRPQHMSVANSDIDFDVDDDEEMQIDTGGDNVTPFTREEVIEAMKSSNFNKGLGPDCFDGNLL